MQRQDGEQLLPLVNNVEYFNIVLEYAEYRIKQLHKSIETAADLNEVLRIQGQIKELRRFKNLRAEVLASENEYQVKK